MTACTAQARALSGSSPACRKPLQDLQNGTLPDPLAVQPRTRLEPAGPAGEEGEAAPETAETGETAEAETTDTAAQEG